MHPATTAGVARRLSQAEDCFKKRQEGAAKLVQLWSSLAQRYSMPLDKDDIVDIRTGKVVEDRGIVSSWDSTHQGSFMDFKPRKKRAVGEVSKCKTNEVDDVDELDAFAPLAQANASRTPEGLKKKKEPSTMEESSDDEIGMLPPSTPTLSPYRSRRRAKGVIDGEDGASDSPPSSSPVILPLELDSEDELGRWEP